MWWPLLSGLFFAGCVAIAGILLAVPFILLKMAGLDAPWFNVPVGQALLMFPQALRVDSRPRRCFGRTVVVALHGPLPPPRDTQPLRDVCPVDGMAQTNTVYVAFVAASFGLGHWAALLVPEDNGPMALACVTVGGVLAVLYVLIMWGHKRTR
jgi:hypothetical protein